MRQETTAFAAITEKHLQASEGMKDLTVVGQWQYLQDDKNNFWITTADIGVWFYDGKTFKNFTENDGLVNNAVMSVLKDKNGNLWFGTKWFGLSRFDGKTFTTFSQYDN
ncbi:MAG: hypothetical protein IPH04_22590 [Saprospirales bacterium]|nr:hypothetical protein [Saprospirales bacterium]